MLPQSVLHAQGVTRAKKRLYLTCPKYRMTPEPRRNQQQADVRDENVLVPSDFLLKITHLANRRLANDEPVLVTENLRVLAKLR
jgi:superfamily I DNA/RNA helicase